MGERVEEREGENESEKRESKRAFPQSLDTALYIPPIIPRRATHTSRSSLGSFLGQVLHMVLVDTEKDILRFDIGVDDATEPVQVVDPEQHLVDNRLDDIMGKPLVIILDNWLEEVTAQHFQHHAHVCH